MPWPDDNPHASWKPTATRDLPRISVVTPSFNQGKFIENTIRSVLGQGYPNLQYIVIDNCSTDGTAAVLEKYRDRIDHLIVEHDAGQSEALNKGLNLADGEILTWINSDDMLAPGALFQVAAAYGISDPPDLVAGSLLYMVDDETLYEHVTSVADGPLDVADFVDVENQWMQGKYFYQPEVFFSRAIFQRAGGAGREDLYYSMDYDLWTRMARAGATIKVIGAPLAIFRAHPDQKTSGPEKYLPELLQHSRALRAEFDLPSPVISQKAIRQLRLAFVTDVPEGGASIAHSRLRQIAADAGFATAMFCLLPRWTAERPSVNVPDLYEAIKDFRPDVVVIGNLHGVDNATSVLEALSINFPCIFYTHDMWLITGRCTYNQGCNKLSTICDEKCPTAAEYPAAAPDGIAMLHRSKLKLQSLGDFQIVANSDWMERNVRSAWRQHSIVDGVRTRISTVTPPCDIARFLSIDRSRARESLGVPQAADVIVCSANNFEDVRKGYLYIVDAVNSLAGRGLKPLIFFTGWMDDRLRSALAAHDNCCFLGYVPPEFMRLVYGAADVLLAAALDEAFGMSYVEAAASGAHSVTFRSGGVENSVCDGVSGVLVDLLTGEALADAVASLLSRKRSGEALSTSSRMWAVANHSDIAVLRRFLSALMQQQQQVRAITPPRTQIHRRRTLDGVFGMDDATPRLQPEFCVNRRTHVQGVGLVEHTIWTQADAPDYKVARFRFGGMRRREHTDAPSHFLYDFKVIERGGTLFMDLRPHESRPPIYRRALVERGSPFLSDEWGPTIFMTIGNQLELEQLEATLPRVEFNNFQHFIAFVLRAFQNVSIHSRASTSMEQAGFVASLDELSGRLERWLPGEANA